MIKTDKNFFSVFDRKAYDLKIRIPEAADLRNIDGFKTDTLTFVFENSKSANLTIKPDNLQDAARLLRKSHDGITKQCEKKLSQLADFIDDYLVKHPRLGIEPSKYERDVINASPNDYQLENIATIVPITTELESLTHYQNGLFVNDKDVFQLYKENPQYLTTALRADSESADFYKEKLLNNDDDLKHHTETYDRLKNLFEERYHFVPKVLPQLEYGLNQMYGYSQGPLPDERLEDFVKNFNRKAVAQVKDTYNPALITLSAMNKVNPSTLTKEQIDILSTYLQTDKLPDYSQIDALYKPLSGREKEYINVLQHPDVAAIYARFHKDADISKLNEEVDNGWRREEQTKFETRYGCSFALNDVDIDGAEKVISMNGLKAYILPYDDLRNFTVGYDTDCCQHYGSAGESCVLTATTKPNAGIFVIEKDTGDDSHGKIEAQAFVWTTGHADENGDFVFDSIVFDNIEFANDQDLNDHWRVQEAYENGVSKEHYGEIKKTMDYEGILAAYVKESPYQNVYMGTAYNRMSKIGNSLSSMEEDAKIYSMKKQGIPNTYSDFHEDARILKKDGKLCMEEQMNMKEEKGELVSDGLKDYQVQTNPKSVRNQMSEEDRRKIALKCYEKNREAIECIPLLWNERDIVKAEIGHNRWLTERMDASFRNDREIMTEAINADGENLQYASDELKNDKDLVLNAVHQRTGNLEFASDELKKDKDFIFGLFNDECHRVLLYTSEELRSNKEFMTEAINRDDRAVFFICGELKKDVDFALDIVKKSPRRYMDLPMEMRLNKDVVLLAVELDRNNLREIPDDFQMDEDAYHKLIDVCKFYTYDKDKMETLITSSNTLTTNKEILLSAIDHGMDIFSELPKEMRGDLDVARAAVDKDPNNLTHALAKVRADKDIVESAVNENGLLLRCASKELKNDQDVVLSAVKNNVNAYKYASDEMKRDRDVCREVMMKYNHYHLKNDIKALVPTDVWKDRDLVMDVVKSDGITLKYASPDLQCDKEVVLAAVENQSDSWKYADESLKYDKDVILKTFNNNQGRHPNAAELLDDMPDGLKKDKDVILAISPFLNYRDIEKCLTKEMSDDRDFVLKLINKQPNVIKILPQYQTDKEVAIAAVKNDSDLISKFPTFMNDKDVIIAGVENNRFALSRDPYHKWNDDEKVVLAGLKMGDEAFVAASDRLKNDKEFVVEAVKLRAWCTHYMSPELFSDKEIFVTAMNHATEWQQSLDINNGLSPMFTASQELKDEYTKDPEAFLAWTPEKDEIVLENNQEYENIEDEEYEENEYSTDIDDVLDECDVMADEYNAGLSGDIEKDTDRDI